MTKTVPRQLQNGLIERVPPRGPVPNRFVGEIVTAMLLVGMIISFLENVKESSRGNIFL
jgi:hypothetical protein